MCTHLAYTRSIANIHLTEDVCTYLIKHNHLEHITGVKYDLAEYTKSN